MTHCRPSDMKKDNEQQNGMFLRKGVKINLPLVRAVRQGKVWVKTGGREVFSRGTARKGAPLALFIATDTILLNLLWACKVRQHRGGDQSSPRTLVLSLHLAKNVVSREGSGPACCSLMAVSCSVRECSSHPRERLWNLPLKEHEPLKSPAALILQGKTQHINLHMVTSSRKDRQDFFSGGISGSFNQTRHLD